VTRPLFTDIEAGVSFQTGVLYWAPPYDGHPDGQRFVMIQPLGGNVATKITVVQNWLRQFERQE
jgi:hypothetical protein